MPEFLVVGCADYHSVLDAGGQAKRIFTLSLPASGDGVKAAAAVASELVVGANPTYCAIAHAEHGTVVYVVDETDSFEGRATGMVRACRLAEDGTLSLLGTARDSAGRHPCYVEVDQTGRWALVANYSEGSVAVFPAQYWAVQYVVQ